MDYAFVGNEVFGLDSARVGRQRLKLTILHSTARWHWTSCGDASVQGIRVMNLKC